VDTITSEVVLHIHDLLDHTGSMVVVDHGNSSGHSLVLGPFSFDKAIAHERFDGFGAGGIALMNDVAIELLEQAFLQRHTDPH